ncbi:MAG: hypothetical protein K9M99_06030 [Candidatus Cloacimonetes bacterium]|nr:hypothetical protein [Candidatus Cloacimonadota bacterium]
MDQLKDIPQIFPQIEDGPESWERFIYKASRGSYKASDMLLHAEWAFMAYKTGIIDDMDEDEYAEILQAQFKDKPDCNSSEELIRILARAAKIELPEYIDTLPIHPQTFYESSWENDSVDGYELLHDAAHYAFENWSYQEYMKLENEILDALDNYNSLHLTAAMILLVFTFLPSCPGAFKNEFFQLPAEHLIR